MTITPNAATVWRDYVTDGVPSSGAWNPQKSDIRSWGGQLEQLLGFASRAAAAATSIPAAQFAVVTAGYAAAGDGGAGVYYRRGGSTAGGFQSLDGQWWGLDLTNVLRPEQFGAAGDGATDDAAAISAWLSAGALRYLPARSYLIKSGLTWSNGGAIFGTGQNSAILVHSSVVGNILTLSPAGGTASYQWTLRDLRISPASGSPGSNIIVFPSDASHFIADSLFENLYIDAFNNGGAAMYMNSTFASGGLFTSKIRRCQIWGGGINFAGCGDSVWIEECILSTAVGGNNYRAITVTAISGAAGPFIRDCNITTLGPAANATTSIFIAGALFPEITGCEIETTGAGPMITLSNCAGAKIEDNGINGLSGPGATANLFLTSGTTHTVIRANRMSVVTTALHLDLDTGIVGNFLAQDNEFYDNTLAAYVTSPYVFGAGSNVPNYGFFILQALSLQNSWTGSVYVTKDGYGRVGFRGGYLVPGTTTPGTVICVLPAGCRPAAQLYVVVPCNNSGTWSLGVLGIATNGNVTVQAAAAELDLGGVNFFTQ